MIVRRLAFLVLLLISLDFASPFVGGAFTFESSAEGLRDHRQGEGAPVRPARAPAPPRLDDARLLRPAPESTRPTRSGSQHSVLALPRAQVRVDASTAPSEDH